MKKIKGLVKMDEERISQRILYVMVGLVVAVFLCFYLIGFDEPFAADSSFNAPMLTDLLIGFMWFLFGIAVVAAGIAAVRSVRLARNNERLSNGVPARKITTIVYGTTFLCLVLTFVSELLGHLLATHFGHVCQQFVVPSALCSRCCDLRSYTLL